MKVVILAGGKGTRFAEYSQKIPKPLAPIGNRPIIWHIMKRYAKYGYKDFIICLGYKGDLIKQYFMEYQTWKNRDIKIAFKSGDVDHDVSFCDHDDVDDWNITLVDTGLETQTGGRIKKVEKYIDTDEFMVTYGDGVADVNVSELVAFHKSHGKIGTITAVNPISQFGILELNDQEYVKSFTEKPRLEKWINGGFFVFKKEFLQYLGENDILEKKPLETLAQNDQLVAHKHAGFWKCMDTFKDHQELNEMWKSNSAPWKTRGGDHV